MDPDELVEEDSKPETIHDETSIFYEPIDGVD